MRGGRGGRVTTNGRRVRVVDPTGCRVTGLSRLRGAEAVGPGSSAGSEAADGILLMTGCPGLEPLGSSIGSPRLPVGGVTRPLARLPVGMIRTSLTRFPDGPSRVSWSRVRVRDPVVDEDGNLPPVNLKSS